MWPWDYSHTKRRWPRASPGMTHNWNLDDTKMDHISSVDMPNMSPRWPKNGILAGIKMNQSCLISETITTLRWRPKGSELSPRETQDDFTIICRPTHKDPKTILFEGKIYSRPGWAQSDPYIYDIFTYIYIYKLHAKQMTSRWLNTDFGWT